MPTTPGRAGRRTAAFAAFPDEVVGDNVRDLRVLARLSQSGLARRMHALGHGWHQATVSEIERGGRGVTTGELWALAVTLRARVPQLLDPAGVAEQGPDAIDIGGRIVPTGAARAWLHPDSPPNNVRWHDDTTWGIDRSRPGRGGRFSDHETTRTHVDDLWHRYQTVSAHLPSDELDLALRTLIGALELDPPANIDDYIDAVLRERRRVGPAPEAVDMLILDTIDRARSFAEADQTQLPETLEQLRHDSDEQDRSG